MRTDTMDLITHCWAIASMVTNIRSMSTEFPQWNIGPWHRRLHRIPYWIGWDSWQTGFFNRGERWRLGRIDWKTLPRRRTSPRPVRVDAQQLSFPRLWSLSGLETSMRIYGEKESTQVTPSPRTLDTRPFSNILSWRVGFGPGVAGGLR